MHLCRAKKTFQVNQSVANEENDHAKEPCQYWTDRRLDGQAEGRTGRQTDRQQSTDKRAPIDSQDEENISMQQLSLSFFFFLYSFAKPSLWVGGGRLNNGGAVVGSETVWAFSSHNYLRCLTQHNDNRL